MLDGISIHLGYFDNIEDTKQARLTKANEVFGVFVNKCEKLIIAIKINSLNLMNYVYLKINLYINIMYRKENE